MAGRDEGVYEWVAANYARSMVQSDPTDTIGVLNLGDESAQVLPSTVALSWKNWMYAQEFVNMVIRVFQYFWWDLTNSRGNGLQVTFVSEKAPPFAYFHKIELRGTTHNLYSYSFDKLGLVRILLPFIRFFMSNNGITYVAFAQLHSKFLTCLWKKRAIMLRIILQISCQILL